MLSSRGLFNVFVRASNLRLCCNNPTKRFSTATTHLYNNNTDVANPQQRPDRLYERLQIELRAHQPDVLKSYSWFALEAAKELEVKVVESIAEPEPHLLRKSVLKSAFVHGKHKVQYEIRTYYHYLEMARLTESTLKTYLEYIQRNLPEGVAMKVTKHERKPLPEVITNTIKNEAAA